MSHPMTLILKELSLLSMMCKVMCSITLTFQRAITRRNRKMLLRRNSKHSIMRQGNLPHQLMLLVEPHLNFLQLIQQRVKTIKLLQRRTAVRVKASLMIRVKAL